MKQFEKYLYLGNVIPEVPKPWEPIILNMLKRIDKIVKPWYIPRHLLYSTSMGMIHVSATIHIDQIKQKFGTLRVYASSNDRIKAIIEEAETQCNNTCEYCGKEKTQLVTIKNWVRNLCQECISKHKS